MGGEAEKAKRERGEVGGGKREKEALSFFFSGIISFLPRLLLPPKLCAPVASQSVTSNTDTHSCVTQANWANGGATQGSRQKCRLSQSH